MQFLHIIDIQWMQLSCILSLRCRPRCQQRVGVLPSKASSHRTTGRPGKCGHCCWLWKEADWAAASSTAMLWGRTEPTLSPKERRTGEGAEPDSSFSDGLQRVCGVGAAGSAHDPDKGTTESRTQIHSYERVTVRKGWLGLLFQWKVGFLGKCLPMMGWAQKASVGIQNSILAWGGMSVNLKRTQVQSRAKAQYTQVDSVMAACMSWIDSQHLLSRVTLTVEKIQKSHSTQSGICSGRG